MKTFKSASWDREFTGTRSEAIKEVRMFLLQKLNEGLSGAKLRYTWRADDDSGFTFECYPEAKGINRVELLRKYNSVDHS